MPLAIACGSCGQQVELSDNAVGKILPCPVCGIRVRVPRPAAAGGPPLLLELADEDESPSPAPPWLLALAALPLGIISIAVVALATGGGRMWDNGVAAVWIILGCGLTVAAGVVALRNQMRLGARAGICMGIAGLAYGSLGMTWLVSTMTAWQTFTSESGGFSVSFPGKPTMADATVTVEGQSLTLHRVYLQVAPAVAYAVIYQELSAEERREPPASLIREVWAETQSRLPIKPFPESEKEVALGGHVGKAVMFEVTVDDALAAGLAMGLPAVDDSLPRNKVVTIFAHYFVANGRLYQVMVSALEGKPRMADIRRFLDSFELTPGTAIAPPASTPKSKPAKKLLKKAPPPRKLDPFEANGEIVDLAATPLGDMLAGAERDGSIRVWKGVSGEEISHLAGVGAGTPHIAFGPDGLLATAGGRDRCVTLWNVTTGKVEFKFPDEAAPAAALAYSNDGRYLAAAHGESVRVWDAKNRKEETSLNVSPDIATALEFGPDNRTLYVGCRRGSIRRFNVVSKDTALALRAQPFEISAIAASPDGKRLLTVNSFTVHMYDLRTGQLVKDSRPPTRRARQVAYSADSQRFVTAGDDVRLWDAETGKQLQAIDYPGKAVAALFLPGGRLAVAGGSPRVRIVNVGR